MTHDLCKICANHFSLAHDQYGHILFPESEQPIIFNHGDQVNCTDIRSYFSTISTCTYLRPASCTHLTFYLSTLFYLKTYVLVVTFLKGMFIFSTH